MKKSMILTAVAFFMFADQCCFALPENWPPGGPKQLYVKPTKKPPHHGVYDEGMKCKDCHTWDGTDAYTSATMAMTKTETGRMPRSEIEEAVRDALKGKGDFREIFVLSTSFENRPLSTVIEFVLDPDTFTLYAVSEKQTEKLFHIAANPHVSLAYVKHVEDYNYFTGALGVQIVGTAEQITGDDPGFADALKIYVPTLPSAPAPAPQPPPLDVMIEMMKKNKIVTKITAERIAIMNRKFKAGGFHALQVWERKTNE